MVAGSSRGGARTLVRRSQGNPTYRGAQVSADRRGAVLPRGEQRRDSQPARKLRDRPVRRRQRGRARRLGPPRHRRQQLDLLPVHPGNGGGLEVSLPERGFRGAEHHYLRWSGSLRRKGADERLHQGGRRGREAAAPGRQARSQHAQVRRLGGAHRQGLGVLLHRRSASGRLPVRDRDQGRSEGRTRLARPCAGAGRFRRRRQPGPGGRQEGHRAQAGERGHPRGDDPRLPRGEGRQVRVRRIRSGQVQARPGRSPPRAGQHPGQGEGSRGTAAIRRRAGGEAEVGAGGGRGRQGGSGRLQQDGQRQRCPASLPHQALFREGRA